MCKQFTSLFFKIIKKIESFIVKITSEEERKEVIINIITLYLSKLKELIFIARGGIKKILVIKYLEKVIFLKLKLILDP